MKRGLFGRRAFGQKPKARLHVLLRSKTNEQGESLPPGAPCGVGYGQSSASCSFAHSLTAAPRLYPHLHQMIKYTKLLDVLSEQSVEPRGAVSK